MQLSILSSEIMRMGIHKTISDKPRLTQGSRLPFVLGGGRGGCRERRVCASSVGDVWAQHHTHPAPYTGLALLPYSNSFNFIYTHTRLYIHLPPTI